MKLWQELRRRRVFRLAGLYIVGAWLVVQVADIVLPAWALPDTAIRYLIIAATLCFPIALVFAWFYDITPDGLVRTQVEDDPDALDLKLKRSDYLILAALLFVGGAILVGSIERIVHTTDETIDVVAPNEKPPNSLAVLPFENLDPNPDTKYFSNGVSEEILLKLSSMRTLKVLGRTSSFAFGDSGHGPKRISDILGVRYLLSGTVRREANKVRVTAMLTDEAGFQVWSDSFDGALEGIFDLQSNIAVQVAAQISDEIIAQRSISRPTSNVEAYRRFLIGREYFNKRPPNWHGKAEAAFRAAIAADPDYPEPYVGLANALTINTGPYRFMANLDEIDSAIAKALELDPNLARAYATRGMTRLDSPVADLDAAIRDLEKSVQLDSNEPMAWSWLAAAYFAVGRPEDGVVAQDRGLAIDPFNVPLVLNTSSRYELAGDIDGAIRHVSRLLELPEPPGAVYVVLSSKYESKQDYLAAIKWIQEAIRQSGPSNAYAVGQLSYLYDLVGMREEADYWFARYEASQTDPLLLLFHQTERYAGLGDTEKASEYLEKFDKGQGFNLEEYPPDYAMAFVEYYVMLGRADVGVERLEQKTGENGSLIDLEAAGVDEIFTLYLLADGYEQLGDVGRATETRARATSIGNIILNNDKSDPDLLFARAFIHGMNANPAEGAAAMDAAIDAGFDRHLAVTADPFLSEAFLAPEFTDARERLNSIVEQHREVIEADNAADDFRSEFERMLAESEQ